MKVITIGRGENNDVILDDPKVSRHHIQVIQTDDGQYRLADFGRNGSYVNGKKITGEVPLNEGDIIRIGNTLIPWMRYFQESGPEDEDFSDHSDNSFTRNETLIEKNDNKDKTQTRKRNGFVTFWLITGIIINLMYSIFSFCTISSSFSFGMNVTAIVSGICMIVCYALLLGWLKIGYWIMIGVATISAVCNVWFNLSRPALSHMSYLPSIIALISAPVGLIVLWAILQIRKNGVSCWKQLK